jgi:multisubunit Na+/H+ antiporter MnhB subunit
MALDRPALLGIICGVAIGGIYIALQRMELRQKSAATERRPVTALVPGALGRLVFLMVAWWLVFEYTDANKYWLTGALVVTYTAPLLVQLRQFVFPKK